MDLARSVLWACAAGLVAYGLWCIVNPHAGVAALTGLGLGNAPATVEAMAMYGGLQVGLGGFLGVGALRATWTAPALGALALAFGGLALARLAGMGLHGVVGMQVFAAAVELVVVALAVTALRRHPSPPGPGRAV